MKFIVKPNSTKNENNTCRGNCRDNCFVDCSGLGW